ncbi:MAG: N(4)-(Beta-N-acetylglucosaminyl)-L-asparaginase [Owenweeksia sp. TMED14]|nr:MAG: N(4)-(Beta-N-acetylglucosaminyl)-L-asparaginase [Owenweeksia sp. TMED14]
MNRNDFLKIITGATAAIPFLSFGRKNNSSIIEPVSIATWRFGVKTTARAMDLIKEGASALDATEAGVKICEADPNERSVGLGGRPDRDGKVTLDACCMDHLGNIGSVAAVEDIVHVSSLARAVMERTPHVMLVGDGARQFAIEMGFDITNLMVPDSENEWNKWLEKSEYNPHVNVENHDTIGQISLDRKGHLAGFCTTSGMGFKMRGRVGDSPIIGAGLYVDGDIGAATATGHGEEVIRVVGSYRVVAEMARGLSPQIACEEAVRKIHQFFIRRNASMKDTQIGFIAINKKGDVGGFSMRPGFQYAVNKLGKEPQLIDANSLLS